MNGYFKRAPVTVNPLYVNSHEIRMKLDGIWCFKLDPGDVGLKEQWYKNPGIMYETVEVPGCWQGQGFGSDQEEEIWDFGLKERIYRATYQGTGWYARTFRIPGEYAGKRLWVNFGGVHPSCDVWVNGIKLGSHGLPFVPFAFEITGVIKYDAENSLVVRVCEDDRIMGLGYNGQGNWSGLYRGVDITATGESYIDRFCTYPDAKEGRIRFKVKIADYSSGMRGLGLAVSVFEEGSRSAVATTKIEVASETLDFDIGVPSPKLWSPDSPNLYRIDAVLTDDGCAPLDALTERTGFVKLSTRGRHILINDEPYYMRGSGDFIANPETGCPDTNRERWRKKLATLREYGYNYVRCQSFVPAPEFFDVADEVGLLVQSEMGMIGAWGGISKWHIFHWPRPNPDYRLKLKSQWDGVVLRDINHPSANIYCMSNEIGNFGHVLQQILHPRITWQCYHETKAMKPSAFVIWTDGGVLEYGNGSVKMPGDFINDVATRDDKCLKSEKPFIQHEFKWWSSFPDIRIAKKYSGAMRPYGVEIAIKAAGKRNLTHMLPVFAENSQRLQFLEAKGKMEECRRDFPELAGINHFNGPDLNPSPQGILDEFYEKKYADSATWLETNGDTVIMMSRGFDERVLCSGGKFVCSFYVSDFSHPPMENPLLAWKLVNGGRILAEGEINYAHVPFRTCPAGSMEVTVPEVSGPSHVKLKAILKEGGRVFTNSWDFWVFPKQQPEYGNTYIYGNPQYTWLKSAASIQSIAPNELENLGKNVVILAEKLDKNILNYVINGGRVVVAASEGLVRPWTATLGLTVGRYFFTPPANWAPFEEGQNGTVIKSHSILGDFPHEGFADMQFYRMIAESAPLDVESLGLSEKDPVIRVIHRYMVSRHLAHLMEFSCGKGMVVLCSMDLNQEWPEASYLLTQILNYVSGAEPGTVQSISEECFKDIIAIGDVV